MSGNEDLLALLNAGLDLGFVVGQDTLEGEFERFATGRGNVVGTAPDVDLLLAEFDAGCSRARA